MSQEDVKEFIKDAVEGGWKNKRHQSYDVNEAGTIKLFDSDEPGTSDCDQRVPVAVALLDPAAWNAVGETRGWPGGFYKDVMRAFACLLTDGWSLNAALRKLGPLRKPGAAEANIKWASYDS